MAHLRITPLGFVQNTQRCLLLSADVFMTLSKIELGRITESAHNFRNNTPQSNVLPCGYREREREREIIRSEVHKTVFLVCKIKLLYNLPLELWNKLPTWCNWIFICVLSARHVSGLHAHPQEQWMLQYLYICSIWCAWFSLVRYRTWGVCVLVACSSAVQHATSTHTPQDRHLTTPGTPYAVYVKKL